MLLMASWAFATTRVREPKLSDLATAWLGGVPHGILEYFRLELDSEGRGLLIVQYLPQSPPRAYRVLATRLKEYAVEFELQPDDIDAERIWLRGHATPSDLDLEVGGIDGDWKRKIFLEREDRVLARIRVVTDYAATVKQRE